MLAWLLGPVVRWVLTRAERALGEFTDEDIDRAIREAVQT